MATFSTLTAFSGITDKAPISPDYVNSKFSQLANNINQLNSDLGSGISGVFFNVRTYGALGDGATDDTVAIQQTLSAASVRGGGTVYIPDGLYLVSGQGTYAGLPYCLQIAQHNMKILMSSGATLKYTGTAGSLMIVAVGTTISGSLSLATYASVSTMQLSLAAVTGLAVGQDLFISDTSNFEVNRIKAISGTTVTLESPTAFSYNTLRSAVVQSYAYWENIHIEGGTLDGNNLSDTGIEYADCKLSSVKNVRVQNTAGTGRGILFATTSNRCTADLNIIRNVNDRGIESYVYTSHNLLQGNTVVAAGVHGVALHGSFNQCLGNRVVGCGTSSSHANIHLDTAKYAVVSGNAVSSSSSGQGIQAAGAEIADLVISNNIVIGSARFGIYLNQVRDASVVDNRVVGSQGIGIFLSVVTGAVVVGNAVRESGNDAFRFNGGDRINIVGNDFTNNAGFGIRLISIATSGSIIGNDLSGNSSTAISGTFGGTIEGNTGNYIQLSTTTPTARAVPRLTIQESIQTAQANLQQAAFTTPDGQALWPSFAFSSESSLGWYRSGASTIQQSYGTTWLNEAWIASGLSVGNATAGGSLIPAISSISSKVAAFVVQGSASSFTRIVWAAAQPGDQILTTIQPDAAASSLSSGLVMASHCTQAGQIEFRLSNVSTLVQNQSSKTYYFTRVSPF